MKVMTPIQEQQLIAKRMEQAQARMTALPGAATTLNQVPPLPPEPTLASMLEVIDVLNKRLGDAEATIARIAEYLIGPIPTDQPKNEAVVPFHVLGWLENKLSRSHALVTDCETSIARILQALGTPLTP